MQLSLSLPEVVNIQEVVNFQEVQGLPLGGVNITDVVVQPEAPIQPEADIQPEAVVEHDAVVQPVAVVRHNGSRTDTDMDEEESKFVPR